MDIFFISSVQNWLMCISFYQILALILFVSFEFYLKVGPLAAYYQIPLRHILLV